MTTSESRFVTTVWEFYERDGRHHLPWRKTKNPYRIVVSELMLQQTQVDRVIPKYQAFIKLFPTVQTLADAPLKDVLMAWQGLGYNRRAKNLKACAERVMSEHQGRFPQTYEELLTLPGIGPYTAGAVMAFAYNSAVPLIETNVRTVYLHHFFHLKTGISDADITKKVIRTLDHTRPREWYAALMDYGSYLKKTHGNNTNRSASYIKQSPLLGSNRHVRGYIISELVKHGGLSLLKLQKNLPKTATVEQLEAQLAKLHTEKMVVKIRSMYHLPGVGQ